MMNKFDPLSGDIIVINYPPGGFGNFLYYVLTEFANETAKPNNNNFKFSKSGNSHEVRKYTQQYYHNPKVYHPFIDSKVDFVGKRILVLCDTGMQYPTLDKAISTFPNAQFIRIVPDQYSKYLLYQTCTEKACIKELNDISYDSLISRWDQLVLTKSIDGWKEIQHSNVYNLSLTQLLLDPVSTISSLMNDIGLTIANADKLPDHCNTWQNQNTRYIAPFKEYYDRTVNS